MTKLLHISDLHAHRPWFNWVADHADEYDLVAYTGDFLDIFGPESLATQVRWINAWSRALPRPLLWCQGNHDVESTAAPVSSGRWMAALPGAKAFSASGQVERMGQSFVSVDWRGATPRLRAGDIVLAHAPPAGCFTATTKGGGADSGDIDLADALRSAAAAPWLVLSGHIHAPARWKDRCGSTITLNPGMGANAAVPNYITVDTATRRARWFRDGELADVADL
jgi:Icc-related predicted phosphoesterase